MNYQVVVEIHKNAKKLAEFVPAEFMAYGAAARFIDTIDTQAHITAISALMCTVYGGATPHFSIREIN